jgi:transposase
MTLPSLDEVACWSAQDTIDRLSRDHLAIVRLQRDLQSIEQQFEWLRRQVFGQKSEHRLPEVLAGQMHLGEMLDLAPAAAEPAAQDKEVPGYKRKRARSDFAAGDREDEANLFFDESRVPVKVIALQNPEIQGLSAEQYEVIGEKVSHRLAQQPGSYVVLKYVRPVIKRKDTQAGALLPASAGRGDRGQPGRCEPDRRRAHRQAAVAPALAPAASAYG